MERQRNRVARRGRRRRSERAQGDHPVLAQDRHEMLHLGVDSAGAVDGAVGLPIVGPLPPVEPAAPRIASRLAPVVFFAETATAVERLALHAPWTLRCA